MIIFTMRMIQMTEIRDVNTGPFCKLDFDCWKSVWNRFLVLLAFI